MLFVAKAWSKLGICGALAEDLHLWVKHQAVKAERPKEGPKNVTICTDTETQGDEWVSLNCRFVDVIVFFTFLFLEVSFLPMVLVMAFLLLISC